MSGEDDLRARDGYGCPDCGWTQRPHPTFGWQGHDDRAVEVHKTQLCPGAYQPCGRDCNGCPTCDPGLATPAEPARESDGVGLREDERRDLCTEVYQALNRKMGEPDQGSGTNSRRWDAAWEVTDAVEKLIAARVAEAGARAWSEGWSRGADDMKETIRWGESCCAPPANPYRKATDQ